jgi:hypothetical protein
MTFAQQSSSSTLPELEQLTVRLAAVFNSIDTHYCRLSAVHREPSNLCGTHDKEIVTCQFEDGIELRLMCKYALNTSGNSYGHRNGGCYEAEVYRQVLGKARETTPILYGSCVNQDTNQTWLFLECLDKALRVHDCFEPGMSIVSAARWIGQFHATNEGQFSDQSFITKYDAAYYVGWARRTLRFADGLRTTFPWLGHLCLRFEDVLDDLLQPPLTVIHGEYTPKNVLIRDGVAYPLDWESAAIAVGEIDLACLTQGWSEFVGDCEEEYRRARWRENVPADFNRRLDIARLYMQFRWLGDRPEWTVDERRRWRFEELRSAGERVGLI